MKYTLLGLVVVIIVFLGGSILLAHHKGNMVPVVSGPQKITEKKTANPSTVIVTNKAKAPELKSHIDMKVVSNPSGFNGELLALTNGERSTKLVESGVLDERARARALVVCTVPFMESAHSGFFTTPGKSLLSDLSNGSAENLARNFDDVPTTHAGFMASPTHRGNIVNPIYRYMGIGHVICPPNDQGTNDVTVEFFTSEAL